MLTLARVIEVLYRKNSIFSNKIYFPGGNFAVLHNVVCQWEIINSKKNLFLNMQSLSIKYLSLTFDMGGWPLLT